jgi:hypothetical protein
MKNEEKYICYCYTLFLRYNNKVLFCSFQTLYLHWAPWLTSTNQSLLCGWVHIDYKTEREFNSLSKCKVVMCKNGR